MSVKESIIVYFILFLIIVAAVMVGLWQGGVF